ncbi:oxygenase MpaB family protein [Jatrophihabitans sp. DSM 45814]
MVREFRAKIASDLFAKVAGADGPEHAKQVHLAAGPRWFGEDRPIRRVHGDASMFVGGLRALLLQSLHPLAMAGVAGHSGYRGDPWGRLARTSHFLAVTTFGAADDAEAMVAKIRGIHERVAGTAPDGRRYAASDPHLLKWVHLAEVDSFLLAHQHYGAAPLDDAGRDDYVADTARVATALGVVDPPLTYLDLRAQLEAYRPELSGTSEARAAARFMLFRPPLPLPARPPYAILAATAIGLLPRWARWPLRLPYLPVAEGTVVRLAGNTIVGGIRWAMVPPAERAARLRAETA